MSTSKAKLLILNVLIPCFLIFSLIQAIAGQPKIEKVVVTGTGLNEQGAIKNAAKAALQQVVGMYVVSDTIMENRKLIKDEVLSHSNAYIQSFKIISKNVDEDGLHEVEASVEVEVGKVFKSLENLNIATKDSIKTDEFIAKVTAKKSGAKEFKSMVENVLLDPFKSNKKIWDIKIHSFDQMEEYNGSRRFIPGDKNKLDNFELTPFRVVFSVNLNDEYLAANVQLYEHSAKEVTPYFKKHNSNKEFGVFLVEVNNDNGVVFKANKSYLFTSYHAKVMKQLMGELRRSYSILRISLLDKGGAVQKSAFYWNGALSTDSGGNMNLPVTELSGSDQLESLQFNYSEKEDEWRRGVFYRIKPNRNHIGMNDCLFGMRITEHDLYLMKQPVRFSAVIYLSLEDIENLGSLQIELKSRSYKKV